MWRAAADLASADRGGALATVARTRGSTPVPAGAKMLVGPHDRLAGSIGGGCVEAQVIEAALEAQRTGTPVLQRHHLNADLAGDLGLSCGGTVDVFVEPLMADERYVAALRGAAAGSDGVMRTAVDWSAGPVKSFEPAAPSPTARMATLTRDGRFVVEQIQSPPRVLVFGAGHVGAAIARAADAAGFQVAIVDDRSDFADPARFPKTTSVLTASPAEAIARVRLGPRDAVVVATRGHRHDAEILALVAMSGAGYVGMLGSRRKKIVVTQALARAGVPRPSLARVRVPVGLAIGAVTPEEIAVSVVAELVQWRRAGTGGNRRERAGRIGD